jgi:hypothetical protein
LWLDTYAEFYKSVITGVNFAPPLYFLLNFIVQLAYPTSIELLRVQSLIWVLIGITISYFLTRKAFGSLPALLATILVVSQSNLLFSQSQEARHYTMFFACGTWVLFMQSRENDYSKTYYIHTFLAHLCLCQVHYLGLVFSGLGGLSYLISNKKKSFIKKIPSSILIAWLITIPMYFFLLSKQSSHLGNWPKPNTFPDLLNVYQDGTQVLFSMILILVITSLIQNHAPVHVPQKSYFNVVLLTSVLWYSVPFIAWFVSHLFPINLFKERYFIPKDGALIFLVCFVCNKIIHMSSQNALKCKITSPIPVLSALVLSLTLLYIQLRRNAFAHEESRNYHYWLLANNDLLDRGYPIVFCGDPLFFPNTYIHPDKSYFLVNSHRMYNIYSQYSPQLKLVISSGLNDFESFILVAGKNGIPHFQSDVFESKDLGKFSDNLNFYCTLFEKKQT